MWEEYCDSAPSPCQELFKTEFSHMLKLSQVMRRCHVMFIKDYTKFYPEGIADDDVYVCESRYIYKVKVFKKYKVRTNLRLFPAVLCG